MRERLTLHGAAVTTADALIIGALVVAAGAAFGPAYGGSRYLLVLAAGALAGVIAVVGPALARWPGWTTVPLAALTYLLFGAVAVPSTAIAGVVPSAESVRLLAVGVVTSWKQLLTVAVPVGGSGALLVPAYLTAVVLTTVGALVAVRSSRPLFAVLAPVAMAAVAAVLGSGDAGHPVLVGTGVAVGALLWAAWRRRRSGRAGLETRRPIALALVLIPAVAVGVFLGPRLTGPDAPGPGQRLVARDVVQPPFDPQTIPGPLSSFRSFVKKDRDTVLFSVTGLPDGGRIRLATMDDYNGLIYGTSAGTGVFNRVGDRMANVPDGDAATLDIQVRGYRGVWVPTSGYLAGVEFTGPRSAELTENFRYDPVTGAGVELGGLAEGDGYVVDVSVPAVPDPAVMSGVPTLSVTQPTPLRVPQEIKTLAGELTADAADPYAAAAALATGLQDAGYVSHGDDGSLKSPSGHGADRIRRLLTSPIMVGDAEQYAVAMALMARSLGMPARVVMGFAPGAHATDAGASQDSATGPSGSVDVVGRDVTAWVEIPFAGHGWVAFDPTPDEAKVPQQRDEEQSESSPKNQLRPPPPPPVATKADTQSVKDSDAQDDEQNEQNEDDVPPPPPGDAEWVGWVLIGLSPLLLLIPLGVVLLLKLLRRRRRRHTGPPAERIAGGWSQVLDTATDLGHRPTSGATRAEAAADLDAAFGAHPDGPGGPGSVGAAGRTGTALLARRADAQVWAPEPVDVDEAERFWAQVEAAEAELRHGVGPVRRLRALVSTKSLRRKAANADRADRDGRRGRGR